MPSETAALAPRRMSARFGADSGTIAAMLGLACVLLGCAGEPEISYLRVDGPAPQIHRAPDARALLVVFWASWCIPCREETPDLLALATDPPEGLSIVTFSHDADMAEVEEYFGQAPEPRLHLRLDPDKATAAAFGVETLPAAFLVTGGRLAARFDGGRKWNSSGMRRLLARLSQPGAGKAD